MYIEKGIHGKLYLWGMLVENKGFTGKIEGSQEKREFLKVYGQKWGFWWKNGGLLGFWPRNRGKSGKSREFDDFRKIVKNREN